MSRSKLFFMSEETHVNVAWHEGYCFISWYLLCDFQHEDTVCYWCQAVDKWTMNLQVQMWFVSWLAACYKDVSVYNCSISSADALRIQQSCIICSVSYSGVILSKSSMLIICIYKHYQQPFVYLIKGCNRSGYNDCQPSQLASSSSKWYQVIMHQVYWCSKCHPGKWERHLSIIDQW